MSDLPRAYGKRDSDDDDRRSASRSSGRRSRDSRSRSRSSDRRSRSKERKRSSKGLSTYYKERFGSRSPEEYQNLRLSHMSKSMEDTEIREVLQDEFENFGPLEIKIVRNPEDGQRLAYLNFEKRGCARKARKRLDELADQLGKHLKMDPAARDVRMLTERGGVIRDQGGRSHDYQGGPPIRRDPPGYRQSGGDRRDYGRDSGPNRYYARDGRSMSGPQRGGPPRSQPRPNEDTLDDAQASRTLFIGNLADDVREKDLRRVFEEYGRIGTLILMHPSKTVPYAFLSFESIQQALDAKLGENDKPLKDGHPRMRVGWAKTVQQQRLWVGGLGDWCTKEMLFNEFDRFGVVDKVDLFKEGWAFVTFESVQNAVQACREMKNFPLGGKDRKLRVDFAAPHECEDCPFKQGGILNKSPTRSGKSSKPRSRSRTPDRHRRRSPSPPTHSPRSPSPTPKKRRRSLSRSESPPKRRQRHSKSTESERSMQSDKEKVRSHKKKKHRRRDSGSRSPSYSPGPDKKRASKRRSNSRSSISPESEKENSAPREISMSRSPTPELDADSVEKLDKIRKPYWTGIAQLKKGAYHIRMFKLLGDDEEFLRTRLKDTNGESVRINVTQRLPWSANNLNEKFAGLGDSANADRIHYLLAVPNNSPTVQAPDLTPKPMNQLATYFEEKAAVGLATLPAGATLYAFPKCELSEKIIARVAPKITILSTMPAAALLIVIVP